MVENSSRRILVAEDDPTTRAVVERLLAGQGYDVVAVADGEAALERLLDEEFDLLVTDINMPYLDGRQLLKEIKARKPAVQVIVTTALRDDESVETCFIHDAFRYLRKPFTRKELLSVVEEALEVAGRGTPPAEVRGGETGWVELTAPSRQEYLDRFQAFCDLLLDSRLDEKARNEIRIAVQEIGQNAIEWGNRLDQDSCIRIAYRLGADRIAIRIADEGEGFDPTTIPDPTGDPISIIENREKLGKRPGGFGIHLARRVMDRITYNEKGNVVVMEKTFAPPRSDAGPPPPQA